MHTILLSPITEIVDSNNLRSTSPVQVLEYITDDCRTQMSTMERLGNIG